MNLSAFKSLKSRWEYQEVNASALAKRLELPLPIASVLMRRGLVTDDAIQDFFEAPLSNLQNPFQMKGMTEAVERISLAIKAGESIYVYGDYDVDGITSTSLLYLFLQELGANAHHYIPNRLEEGYGLNVDAIHELAAKGAALIVTVDCGISAIKEVALAKEIGLDIVITDHHQPGDTLPEGIIINPLQAGDNYPFKHLAGVGVAFKLCMALRHYLRSDENYKGALPNLKKYLDIVAMGTIADVVPLLGENRSFVLHGLTVLASKNLRPGLAELKKVAGLTRTIAASNIGFDLAPRINAVGRMGDSDRGFRLIVTDNENEARRLAGELDAENRFRQNIEREILHEAIEYIEKNKLPETRAGFVIHSERWHPGVLGIVASRIADKYFKPTIVLTSDGQQMKGSARSIPGYHLYEGLSELSDLLLSFGGHKYAAGLKIKKENIPALEDRFDASVREKLTKEDFIPCINIDAVVDASDINERFLSVLSKFEPFGNSNKEPIFCMKNVEKYQHEHFVGKNKQHLKCLFIKKGIVFDAIGYEMRMYEELIKSNNHFDILFTLSYNSYGRSSAIQLTLKDIRAVE